MEIKDGVRIFSDLEDCLDRINSGEIVDGEFYILKEEIRKDYGPAYHMYYVEKSYGENYGGFFKLERALEYIELLKKYVVEFHTVREVDIHLWKENHSLDFRAFIAAKNLVKKFMERGEKGKAQEVIHLMESRTTIMDKTLNKILEE